MLKNIPIDAIVPSKTNPRGGKFDGPAFTDLVNSIKTKGVLMPILVRPIATGQFEVVAGHRRLAASILAGLKDVPTQVVGMNDIEAREAQIVENLQRQDIHPLDEGEAYRLLIEKSSPRYETKDVALKVGKSESYVRGRLGLTNLSEKASTAYRKDLITIGHAVLISKIDDEKIAKQALQRVTDYGDDVSDLRDWIKETMYASLSNKPWAKDAKLAEMVGDTSSKGPNLFNDPKADVDPVALAQQMAAFIEIKTREYKDKGLELVKISTSYGQPEVKGALARDSFSIITSGFSKFKKLQDAIIVEGDEIGKIVKITTEKDEARGSTVYKQSPKEKEERRKENQKLKKQKEKYAQDFQAVIKTIKFPLSEKHLNALFEFTLNKQGVSIQQPAVSLLGLEPVMKKEKVYSWDSKQETKYRMARDHEATLRKYANDNGTDGKLKVIFSLLMSHPSTYSTEGFAKDVKKI